MKTLRHTVSHVPKRLLIRHTDFSRLVATNEPSFAIANTNRHYSLGIRDQMLFEYDTFVQKKYQNVNNQPYINAKYIPQVERPTARLELRDYATSMTYLKRNDDSSIPLAVTYEDKGIEVFDLWSGKSIAYEERPFDPNTFESRHVDSLNDKIVVATVPNRERRDSSMISSKFIVVDFSQEEGNRIENVIYYPFARVSMNGRTNLVTFGERYAIVGFEDGSLAVLDIIKKGGTVIQSTTIHDVAINCIELLPFDRVATAGMDRSIRITSLRTNECESILSVSEEYPVSSLCTFDSDASILASSCGSIVKLWDINTGECIARYEGQGHNDNVNQVLSIGSNMLATASNDGLVKILHYQNGELKLLKELHGQFDCIYNLSLLPNSGQRQIGQLVSCANDLTLVVWELTRDTSTLWGRQKMLKNLLKQNHLPPKRMQTIHEQHYRQRPYGSNDTQFVGFGYVLAFMGMLVFVKSINSYDKGFAYSRTLLTEDNYLGIERPTLKHARGEIVDKKEYHISGDDSLAMKVTYRFEAMDDFGERHTIEGHRIQCGSPFTLVEILSGESLKARIHELRVGDSVPVYYDAHKVKGDKCDMSFLVADDCASQNKRLLITSFIMIVAGFGLLGRHRIKSSLSKLSHV
jgi:hypothetical protein